MILLPLHHIRGVSELMFQGAELAHRVLSHPPQSVPRSDIRVMSMGVVIDPIAIESRTLTTTLCLALEHHPFSGAAMEMRSGLIVRFVLTGLGDLLARFSMDPRDEVFSADKVKKITKRTTS